MELVIIVAAVVVVLCVTTLAVVLLMTKVWMKHAIEDPYGYDQSHR